MKIPIEQSTQIGLLVLAQALILIIGRMDLSLESTFGLAPAVAVWAVVGASMTGTGGFLNGQFALLAGVGLGVLIGITNALMIVKFRLNGFIVTLGMLTALRGLQTFDRWREFVSITQTISSPCRYGILGMSLSFWVFVVTAGVLMFVMKYTRLGRSLYAIGGNVDAARAAGIRVDRIVMGTLIFASVLAAIAGILYTVQYASVGQTQGSGYIFTVFAACVIGGISLNGGRGSVFGALTGILLLKFIDQLLRSMQVSGTVIELITGTFILVALIISRIASGKLQD